MKLLITSALLFLAISPLVQAKHDRKYQNNHEYSRGEFKAKVIDFTPVYKYVTVNQPKKYCEPSVIHSIHRRSHDSRRHYKNSAIVGGFLGGVIGHTASDKNHKGLGTILGAVIGSSLVHNIGYANNNHTLNNHIHNNHTLNNHIHNIHNIHNIQHKRHSCMVTPNKTNKTRVLEGYRITYRTQGKIYLTFRQEKPKKYIRIYY